MHSLCYIVAMNEKNIKTKIDVISEDHEAEIVPVDFSKDIGDVAVKGAEGNPWHGLEDDTTDTADFPNPNTPYSDEVIQEKDAPVVLRGTPEDQLPTADTVTNPNSPEDERQYNPDGTFDF